jgi:anti-anti-sigma factor
MEQLDLVPVNVTPLPPVPPVGDVSVFFDSGVTLISMSGEVDLALSSDLEHAARAAASRDLPIQVNVSQMTFVDSTGIRFLARLVPTGTAPTWRLRVEGASLLVQHSLRISGILPLLDLL